MSGVELIIFGIGPAFGLCISLVAWLYESHTPLSSDQKQQQYNHDWI